MRDIKDYLEQTNTVLLTKDAFEHLKERASALDKIRAEIEWLKLHKAEFLTSDNKVCIDSQEVLDIIDHYKAESEE